MRTNFVLIDSENVKLEYIEKLKHEHFRVFVFVGPNRKRLEIPIVTALQANGTYVRMTSHGPNALDFHIISKDKGFDPLIKHLREQKVFCSRSASVSELVSSKDKLSPRQRALDFYKKRLASAKARPATVMSLQRAILSHFSKALSKDQVAEVVKALTAARHLAVSGNKVVYPEHG